MTLIGACILIVVAGILFSSHTSEQHFCRFNLSLEMKC